MQQKTVVLTVILFALIVLGMFIYARIKASEDSFGMKFFDLVIAHSHEIAS